MKNIRLTVAAAYLALSLLAAGGAASARQQPGGEKCPSHIVVEGAVRSPTRFELQGEVRLLQALARAGGLTEDASNAIRVTNSSPGCGAAAREGDDSSGGGTQVYDIIRDLLERKADPPLRPGDVVTVDRAPMFYVMGGVRQPQALYLKGSFTVKQAVAMAGGWRRDARPDKARIYRRAPGSTDPITTLSVNLKAIRKKQAKDVELQANDILWVPCKGCGSDPSPTLPPPVKGNLSGPHLRVIY